MFDEKTMDNPLDNEELIKENRSLKRQLRNLESTFQRNKAMLAARTTVNDMLESEQKKMERHMNLLLENSADIILLLDKDRDFTYFTKTFLKATGLTDTGLITGKFFFDVFSPRLSKNWLDLIEANINLAIERRSTVVINSSVDLSGGDNPQEYDIQITPMVDQNAHLEAFMLLLHNITDIMRAKRQAESANIAKSQFLATMSHEMRTPMNAVLGMTAIGKMSDSKERMLYCFSKIEDASQHLLGVINDILDVSKIEAGRLELSPTLFNFEEMLKKIINIINFQAVEKNQKLSINIDEAIPRNLIGDDQRLAQVITNLLGNAVKFTPYGGAVNLNTLLVGEQNGAYEIQFTVSDTGIGISPEQQSLLFRPFHQAEGDITRKFGGTGLGLSISKSIIKMMGGKIRVESELGKGSSFIFTVHLEKGADENASLSLTADCKGIRILVVDADQNTPIFFDEFSQKFGAHYDIASSTKEAVSLIEKNGNYDICFVDGKMPDFDVIRSKKAFNSIEKRFSNIVIMSSSADWNSFGEDSEKTGVDRFVSKPLFKSSVADVITEILDAKQKAAAEQAGTEINFGGKCILLVDDVEINREIVLALLESTLLEIDCAENGAEAVRMFNEMPDRYSMIFMDIQMPEMDGYEATRRIRTSNSANAKTIPIIAMTANVFREDIERCMEAGMNDHIGKPVSFDEIIRHLILYL